MVLARYIEEVSHHSHNLIDLCYKLEYSKELKFLISKMAEQRYLGAEIPYEEMIYDNLGEIMDRMDLDQTIVMDFNDDGQRERGWYPLVEDIAMGLCDIGYLYHGQGINWGNVSLVLHKYFDIPNQKYLMGMFLTSKEVIALDGLPGSSREKVGDRPYIGIALRNDQKIKYCVSYGSALSLPYKKDIFELTEGESNLVNNLLCYTYLMSGIDL